MPWPGPYRESRYCGASRPRLLRRRHVLEPFAGCSGRAGQGDARPGHRMAADPAAARVEALARPRKAPRTARQPRSGDRADTGREAGEGSRPARRFPGPCDDGGRGGPARPQPGPGGPGGLRWPARSSGSARSGGPAPSAPVPRIPAARLTAGLCTRSVPCSPAGQPSSPAWHPRGPRSGAGSRSRSCWEARRESGSLAWSASSARCAPASARSCCAVPVRLTAPASRSRRSRRCWPGERYRAAARARLFGQVLAALGHMSERAPVVLAIEDAHWAGRSARDLLWSLVRNQQRMGRVMVLITFRSDELHRMHPLRLLLAQLGCIRWVRRASLPPLSRDETAEQVAGILAGEPEPGLAESVYARSAGIPLLVEELARCDQPGCQSVHDLVLAGARRLPPDTQGVLRAASAGGGWVGHALLARVTGVTDDRLPAVIRPAI